MKVLLLIVALASATYGQTAVYDKFSDSTYYKSKRVQVYRNRGGLLVYSPAKVDAQTGRSGADKYTLILSVDSYSWQFARDCSVQILADTKRYSLACSVEYSNAFTLVRSVYVTEGLVVRITANEFKDILTAKSVEMRVGVYEFKLKDKQLKELASVLYTPPNMDESGKTKTPTP